MITFSQLGSKGNLGNQLFQIASTIGLARENNQNWCFPKWDPSLYFNSHLPKCDCQESFQLISEKCYHFHEWPIKKGNFDLEGWLQTEKYFDIPYTKELFSFKPEFKQKLLEDYKHIFKKKSILISIRRGDFVHHPLYFQLSYKYYFLALLKHFPDWKDCNILFTSDDISYCKSHFGKLPNAFFLENIPPVEQLIISSNCNHFIISNSTFSWWQAWLGEKTNSLIIRPPKNHRNTRHVQFDDKDYFPDRWIRFDHRGKNFPLRYSYTLYLGEKYRMKSFIKNKWNGLRHRLRVK